MAIEDSPKQPTPVDELLSRIEAGVASKALQGHLGQYIYASIWSAVTKICNTPASDINALIDLRGELKAMMKLAQKFKVDVIDAEIATAELKKAYEAKNSTPALRR